jgi:hypothetical protein
MSSGLPPLYTCRQHDTADTEHSQSKHQLGATAEECFGCAEHVTSSNSQMHAYSHRQHLLHNDVRGAVLMSVHV